VGIPLVLTRIGRRSAGAAFEGAAGGSFRDWRRGDFSVWRSRVRGSEAAIEILLPLAAVALGMLAFAIVAAIVLPCGAAHVALLTRAVRGPTLPSQRWANERGGSDDSIHMPARRRGGRAACGARGRLGAGGARHVCAGRFARRAGGRRRA